MLCRCMSSGRGPEESGAVDGLREPSTDGRCSSRVCEPSRMFLTRAARCGALDAIEGLMCFAAYPYPLAHAA